MTTTQSDYSPQDFAVSPLMFYYEVTLACDLVCKHCRASAQENPDPDELSTDQAKALLDQVAHFPRRPTLVLTGGDPLKRPRSAGVDPSCRGGGAANGPDALGHAAGHLRGVGAGRAAGVRSLGISLDGADAATHDAFRGLEGSFARTIEMLDFARRLEMAVQVNTTITRRNVHQVDAIAELLAAKGIAMWSVFFLVPVGRGIEEERIRPEEYEQVFERLWHHARRQPYAVKTTEAPHYRRFVLQRGGDPLAEPGSWGGGCATRGDSATVTANDPGPVTAIAPRWASATAGASCSSATPAKSIPPGFFRLLRTVPQDSVIEVYQKHPTFLALRDPDGFKGRCGICEFRRVCGGSRARAYALTGDYLGDRSRLRLHSPLPLGEGPGVRALRHRSQLAVSRLAAEYSHRAPYPNPLKGRGDSCSISPRRSG